MGVEGEVGTSGSFFVLIVDECECEEEDIPLATRRGGPIVPLLFVCECECECEWGRPDRGDATPIVVGIRRLLGGGGAACLDLFVLL